MQTTHNFAFGSSDKVTVNKDSTPADVQIIESILLWNIVITVLLSSAHPNIQSRGRVWVGQENKNKKNSTNKITVRSAKKTGEAQNWERFTVTPPDERLGRL